MSTYNATKAAWEPDDPFAHIPEVPKHEVTNEPRAGKPIKQLGETAKPRKSSNQLKRLYEGLTRDRWRKAGYHVDRCSNENAYTGKSHDLFGLADFAAVGNGELVLIQVTSRDGISAHKKKILTEDWAVTNGKRYLSYDSLLMILAVPGVRFVIDGWHKPDRFWVCEQIVVTPEVLESWRAKREKRAGAA